MTCDTFKKMGRKFLSFLAITIQTERPMAELGCAKLEMIARKMFLTTDASGLSVERGATSNAYIARFGT